MTDSRNRGGEAGGYPRRGFWALIVTQAQGAFNDNLFQFIIIYYLIAQYSLAGDGGVYEIGFGDWSFSLVMAENVQNIATLLFSLPFIIFPAMFGAMSDRYTKQRVAMITKYWEVGIMVLGGVAFYLGAPSFIWLLLFLMAMQSAMFGPAKYGILPEILEEKQLSSGNGIIQLTTMAAIIAGVALAGPVFGMVKDAVYQASFVLVIFSVLGLTSSFFISKPPAANPAIKIPLNPLVPWSGMGPYFKAIWNDRVLLNVVVGYTYFWFAGLMVRNNLVAFSSSTLEISAALTSYFLASVTIGIGVGALGAGFLSRGKIEMGLVPIGALGMGVFSLLLAVPAGIYQSTVLPLFDLFFVQWVGLPAPGFDAGTVSAGYYLLLQVMVFGLGIFAGVFDVPLAAALQQYSPRDMKGGIIATSNMLTFLFMSVGSVLMMVMSSMGLTPYQVFAVCAFMSLLMGGYIVNRLPLMILRAYLWVLANTRYRIKVLGRNNVLEMGGALMIANHTSMVDVLVLLASNDRRVRFVAGKDVLRVKWMARIVKMADMITYDPDSDTDCKRMVEEARAAMQAGEVVCLTTEGPLKADGTRSEAQYDYKAFMDGLDVPLVPVHMDTIWGKLYKFEGDQLIKLKPTRKRYPIQVHYGEHLDQNATREDMYNTIHKLGTEAYFQRPLGAKLLYHGFIRSARRNLFKPSLADGVSGQLNYFKVLVGSIVFARKLKKLLGKGEMVGVVVPPSVGGVLTNLALTMLGRVAVNLNYTMSNEGIASCIEQCNIDTVLTSKKVLERLPIELPGNVIYLEDIKESAKGSDRIVAILLALLAPIAVLEMVLGTVKRTQEDLVTVIFSSGSEGEPKGVMLSHRNISNNMETGLEVFPHDRDTCVIGYLPLFHSFGYMVTIWMVVCHGLQAMYHTSPLEYKVIGKMVKQYKGTLMVGTSTLLQGFIRRCTPEQFETLDFVVTGAEKLAPRVRLAFKEKFGVEPLEGYGTTECAPGVAVNIPDRVSPGFCYLGTRHGTIGRLLPSQSAKVTDPDTGEDLPMGEAGLLHIKGPNIMQGYLNQPEKTASVLVDGWYATGDIAALSEDGFITITDRLSRFSKIGGEMVPHNKIEEVMHNLLELTEQMLFVASVPDEKKGERLVVLHVLEDAHIAVLKEKLSVCDLPNLWIPRGNAFHKIEELPVMATGKMDIKVARQMAVSMAGGE